MTKRMSPAMCSQRKSVLQHVMMVQALVLVTLCCVLFGQMVTQDTAAPDRQELRQVALAGGNVAEPNAPSSRRIRQPVLHPARVGSLTIRAALIEAPETAPQVEDEPAPPRRAVSAVLPVVFRDWATGSCQTSPRPPTVVASLASAPAKGNPGATNPVDAKLGTAIDWVKTRAEAKRRARQEGKLVFEIHVSGNFELPEFT